MKFEDIIDLKQIYLYCGDKEKNRKIETNKKFIGLSLSQDNDNHIRFDITNKMNLKNNSVDIVQSEDVMEHIEYSQLKDIINEIYRVLKPNGIFRLSMPDYECDLLRKRSYYNSQYELVFDYHGGGDYDFANKKVINGGHVWFPTYSSVKSLLESTNFSNDKINFLHYYDENKKPITNKIDYTLGWIDRTPDHDERVQNPYRPMSIIIDCYK